MVVLWGPFHDRLFEQLSYLSLSGRARGLFALAGTHFMKSEGLYNHCRILYVIALLGLGPKPFLGTFFPRFTGSRPWKFCHLTFEFA